MSLFSLNEWKSERFLAFKPFKASTQQIDDLFDDAKCAFCRQHFTIYLTYTSK